MRLSDLLGADVVDEAGRHAGRVHDVRLVQDGPLVGSFGASLRVDGLLLGGRAIGVRLGYGRRQMHGPFLLKLVTGRLLHDGRYVDWDRVRSVEENRILISGSADDLPRSAPPT